jgi:hypothetical protein
MNNKRKKKEKTTCKCIIISKQKLKALKIQSFWAQWDTAKKLGSMLANLRASLGFT